MCIFQRTMPIPDIRSGFKNCGYPDRLSGAFAMTSCNALAAAAPMVGFAAVDHFGQAFRKR